MEIDRKEALDRIEKEIKELPEKAQRAIYWVVKNYGLVTKICKEPEMTNEEIQACKETAREKDDYIALAASPDSFATYGAQR